MTATINFTDACIVVSSRQIHIAVEGETNHIVNIHLGRKIKDLSTKAIKLRLW